MKRQEHVQANDDALRNDLLIGAAAIAAELGLTRRQVYAMREAGHPLITNEPGLGIVARRSLLRRHFGHALDGNRKSA